MSQLHYHSIQPDALRDSFGPSDIVTFSIAVGEGRALLNGSVKIEGQLDVQQNGVRVTLANDVRIDPFLGAEALFAEVNTISDRLGVVEQTGSALARAVRQIKDLTRRPSDLFTATDVAALRSPDELLTRALLRGTQTPGQATAIDAPYFSVTPTIALNRANGAIAFSKTGELRVQLRMATVADALYGGGVNINTNYGVSNIRLTCQSVPDSMAPAQVTARTFSTVESTVQTRSGIVSTRLPAVCDAITISMISNARRSQFVFNNAESQRPTGIEEVVLQLNDSVNGQISAPVDDEAELLRLAVEATGGSLHNSVAPTELTKLRKFHIGYPLGAPMDMSQTPFKIQITAGGISNTNPFVLTVIGHGIFNL